MADEAGKTPNPFDVRTIKELVGLMSRHDLAEIDLRDGEARLRIRRGGKPAPPTAFALSPVATPAAPPPTSAAPAPTAKAAEPTKAAKNFQEIKSPTPGTFYSTPSPDAEPFVRVGSRVTPTTVVCIIEAMKIFNEITADCTGVVADVLAENQQPVEYGQVLFRVEPG